MRKLNQMVNDDWVDLIRLTCKRYQIILTPLYPLQKQEEVTDPRDSIFTSDQWMSLQRTRKYRINNFI